LQLPFRVPASRGKGCGTRGCGTRRGGEPACRGSAGASSSPVCLPASSSASRCHSQVQTPEEAPAATTGARVTSHRPRLAAAAATNAFQAREPSGDAARLPGWQHEDLGARGDQGNDEERRQRDQHVDKAAHDHAANSLKLPRCRLHRRAEALLRQPHCLAAASAVHRE
jgi:hypothetical protein